MKLGSVYILQTTDERYVKIGFTTRLGLRLQEIQCTMFAHEHGGIELLGFFPASVEVETQLHQQFSGYRLRGDWYERGPVLERFTSVVVPVTAPEILSTPYIIQSAGGAARASILTLERRREIAAAGGSAAAKKLTPTQHKRRMKKLLRLRWNQYRAKKAG